MLRGVHTTQMQQTFQAEGHSLGTAHWGASCLPGTLGIIKIPVLWNEHDSEKRGPARGLVLVN